MGSPVTISTTAMQVAVKNKRRASIKFQNSGNIIIYIKKIPTSGSYGLVSPTDFEFKLFPVIESSEGAESFETNSISGFMAISSASGGQLAIYETNKVKI